MIPLKLIIEGLYSYQDRQIIDFTSLTDAGLFGIFGAVGSGKSSILEAITYALYGETERLNARDKRTYNMMNLKSNRSYIEFDFINHENETYRATREFKRNSKNFDDVRPPIVTFYHLKNNEWIPLQNADAEKIIGLSYTNFKRTIIIPQGQFKEFLELGEAERTKMMKEIFGLHKFDLFENASKLNKKNQTELDILQGELKGFESITQENIIDLSNKLSNAEANYENLTIQLTQQNNVYQQLKNDKLDVELLETKSNEFNILENNKSELSLRKNFVDEFEIISKTFNPLLKDKNRTTHEIEENTKQINIFTENLNSITKQLQEVDEQITYWQKQYDYLPVKRKEEFDWEFIIKNIQSEQNLKALQLRLNKGNDVLENLENEIKTIDKKIVETEKEQQLLSGKRTNTQLLLEIDQWFVKKENLQKQLTKQKQEVEVQQQQLDKLTERAALQQLNIDTFDEDINVFKLEFNRKKEHFTQQKNQLLVQQQIAAYAHELHDGKPCLLCGATEHPDVVKINDVTENLKQIDNELTLLDKIALEWQNKASEVLRIKELKQIFSNQLANEITKFQEIESMFNNHLNNFIWVSFNKNNYEEFLKQKEASLSIEHKLQELSNLLQEYRSDLELKRQNFDRYRNELEIIKKQEIQLSAEISHNISSLQVLNCNDYSDISIDIARKTLENLKKTNAEIEINFQKNIDLKNNLSQQQSANNASIEVLQNKNNSLLIELELIDKQIDEALINHKKENLDAVLAVINQEIDVIAERKIWDDFNVKYQTLKQQIFELKAKVTQQNFNEEKFILQEQLVNDLTEKLKLATEIKATLKADKERNEKAFEEKRLLLEKLNTLQNNADNLKVMLNLFKGSGFVQYISSIYLRELCNHANDRFHRMTRNQLSLQLNEKGDFEIIDYLNEGKSRSVKTLSGGQAFQASLCLALALAESVQTNAKAERNFFFIDEGFGTQDNESVNIVFETLTSLQKENRIVGIISHVEELKERIPIALTIKKDEQFGSTITLSN